MKLFKSVKLWSLWFHQLNITHIVCCHDCRMLALCTCRGPSKLSSMIFSVAYLRYSWQALLIIDSARGQDSSSEMTERCRLVLAEFSNKLSTMRRKWKICFVPFPVKMVANCITSPATILAWKEISKRKSQIKSISSNKFDLIYFNELIHNLRKSNMCVVPFPLARNQSMNLLVHTYDLVWVHSGALRLTCHAASQHAL